MKVDVVIGSDRKATIEVVGWRYQPELIVRTHLYSEYNKIPEIKLSRDSAIALAHHLLTLTES
jgi:hypothetical protein